MPVDALEVALPGDRPVSGLRGHRPVQEQAARIHDLAADALRRPSVAAKVMAGDPTRQAVNQAQT
ncbi:DUF6192 family protein [Streptomyces sp. AgN23]|uniref:DUF6192 family protein n=1 Tax=Streptomyces sp. AgN23 TaxID=1188315 RepID=UPI001B334653|nr:DUF6192 family protein [Streptomyces sp. AgN23]QTI87913.1 hypothetical protein AS97_44225 [Streptomyces sp. AgN23]